MGFVVCSRRGGGTRLTSESSFLQIRNILIPNAIHLLRILLSQNVLDLLLYPLPWKEKLCVGWGWGWG